MNTKPHTSKRGFALVATLTLMILVGLIAVGILAMISAQNRTAMQTAVQTAARQQALIGLDDAISELQMALGPDQRVSASSGILSEKSDTPQHILGVWDSWTQPLYGKKEHSIQETYTQGRSSNFRRWLISSRNRNAVTRMDAVTGLGKRMPGVRICLVGEGTLGSSADKNEYIYADLIEMPVLSKNTGCYAWWVTGENQKANISITERPEASDSTEQLSRTWDTPAPSFVGVDSLAFLDTLTTEDKQRLYSRGSLPLLLNTTTQDNSELFHNVTLYSKSLMTNVRDGGLKHDLNMLLSKEKLDNTPFAARKDSDCPIADDEELPVGAEQNIPVGSWQVLHAYYNTWPNGEGKESESFNARLLGNTQEAWTTMCGNIINSTTLKGDRVTYFDNRATGTAQSGYARVPLLTTFLGCWGLNVSMTIYRKGHTLHYLYSPMIMWWNPYNVRMKVGAQKLWCYALPYRTTAVQVWSETAQHYSDSKRPWSSKIMMHPCSGDGFFHLPWQCMFRLDWGNYFINSATDPNSDIIFEPGEIIAFTMSGNIFSLNEVHEVGDPHDCPFVVGDQPDVMTCYRSDFREYVNVTDPTAHDMAYNAYIDLFTARMTMENAKNPSFNAYTYYGSGSEKQSDFLVTMGEVLMNASQYLNQDHVKTIGRESFSVLFGYDGIMVPSLGDPDEKRAKGEVDRFSGAKGISPASFTLGWYDNMNIKDDDMVFMDTKWNVGMLTSLPSYHVAVGIVPKSYNTSLNEGFPLFRGKDYRSKIWQHSSPAFWSSTLYKPDDQMRQYHPYQLAAIELGAGANRGPLDTVNGRNGVYGLFSSAIGGGENVSFISVLELPYHPPFSLAGFAGMRLTPGWFNSSGNTKNETGESIARMRRMQYQAGVPGVGIGNSFADPCIGADEVYTFHENKANKSELITSQLFSDFYDHGFLINDALWDRWFCSSVSDMPTHSSRGKQPMRDTLTKFVEGEKSLPVSRYELNGSIKDTKTLIDRLMGDDGWQHIARYLIINGGFNINSVSEEAWAATLQGLAKRELMTNGHKNLRKIEKDKNSVLFSRFMVSTSSRPLDRDYSPLQGSTQLRPSLKMAAAWGEVRALQPEDIRELAREIVKQVRQRGPFLNMADFVNRRLDGGSDASLTGALQAAIDATDINSMFKDQDYNVKVQKQGTLYKYPKAAEGSMYTAAPGYLIQSDVLSSLGNILTVRDDTFVVRAYGCVKNAADVVLAQAWCEATVQRTIDYVDPTNKPDDTDSEEQAMNKRDNTKLTELNRLMGRRFKIVSFRWLDAWDI